jgi:hypothetical protein
LSGARSAEDAVVEIIEEQNEPLPLGGDGQVLRKPRRCARFCRGEGSGRTRGVPRSDNQAATGLVKRAQKDRPAYALKSTGVFCG